MVARNSREYAGGINPQAVDAILLDREPNPIVIRLDEGVGFSVDPP